MEEKVEVAEPTVSMDDMTIDEKIRAILRRNPAASARDIKRLLNTEEFGFTKVGWFEARRRMKTSKRV
jgi:hypothetical protein